MPANTKSTKTTITPAAGLSAHLKNKSRSRREAQQALTSIGVHAPAQRNDLLPQLNIVYAPILDIKSAVRRVRRKDATQTARVLSSIRKFGIVAPILVDQNFRIVHGHAVYEAAREAGLLKMPVICIDHLESSELRLLSIALNRLAETGKWDDDILRLEVEELLDCGEDVFVTGFETAEIDNLLLVDDDAAAEDESGVDGLLPVDPVSRHGDIWVLGRHRLLQGDARDSANYARLMAPGEFARIVLTDTPYNVPNAGHVTTQAHHREFAMAGGEMSREEFAGFIRDWMEASSAHVVDGGLLATFIDWRSIDLVLGCGHELGLQLLNVVVWAKSNGGQGSFWRSQHEFLPVFKKGAAAHVNNVELGRFGRWRSNLWTYAGASSLGSDARDGLSVHPTVKPRLLLEDALLDVSQRDEIVLEPFAGSGSTLLAAESVGRICRAIEIDGAYCDLVIKRWQVMTGSDAILENSGKTHTQVAQRRTNREDA